MVASIAAQTAGCDNTPATAGLHGKPGLGSGGSTTENILLQINLMVSTAEIASQNELQWVLTAVRWSGEIEPEEKKAWGFYVSDNKKGIIATIYYFSEQYFHVHFPLSTLEIKIDSNHKQSGLHLSLRDCVIAVMTRWHKISFLCSTLRNSKPQCTRTCTHTYKHLHIHARTCIFSHSSLCTAEVDYDNHGKQS